MFLGKLLRGFIHSNENALLPLNENEFFVPTTRNQTMFAMDKLFRLFKGSNKFQSANDMSHGKQNFRIGFLPDSQTQQIRAFLFTVNMNVTFNSFTVQHAYYNQLQNYFQQCLDKLKLSKNASNRQIYQQIKHG